MPGLDRRGPLGQGPGTGRGMGVCGSNRGFGNGISSGFQGAGRRMGSRGIWRNSPVPGFDYKANPDINESTSDRNNSGDVQALSTQILELQRTLGDLNKRIEGLEQK